MRIRYKARALRHLQNIHGYIAGDNPTAAAHVVSRIEAAIQRLDILPLSARPGTVPGTRVLAVPGIPYVVIHRVRGDTVDILAVLHTARERRS